MRFLALPLFLLLALVGRGVYQRLEPSEAADPPTESRLPVPVEVAAVERGPVALRRTFSGALEATAAFTAAPNVGGRVVRLTVELGDEVTRGQTVAWLDDGEYQQAVQQAEAELAVAEASHTEAASNLEVAERSLRRADSLREEGVTSESQMDTARATELAARAQLQVAAARVTRAESQLETARIRLEYTRVRADWNEGDDRRVVSERMVDEGTTVSANTALMRVVELDPIVAVVFVPERDYAQLEIDQVASLALDSYPERTFAGRVARIAPVFRRSTRQARVEIQVDNAEELLKPGMYARATIELDRSDRATLIPFAALTEREGQTGVFVLADDGQSVAWQGVRPGIREGDRVELLGSELHGHVVVLGQELCEDGARVTVPGETREAGQLRSDSAQTAAWTPR